MPVIAFATSAESIHEVLFIRWARLRPLFQFNYNDILMLVVVISADKEIYPVARLDQLVLDSDVDVPVEIRLL